MSGRQNQQDQPESSQQDQPELQQQDQPESQQHDGQVVLPPPPLAMLHTIAVLVDLSYNLMMDHFGPLYFRTPYHTSALSGADWVNKLLTRHPERIWNELGVHRNTFLVLVEALKRSGLQSSCHVSIEEQLSIFLYTAVTGLTCTHVGERFQQSTDMITK